MFGKLAVSNIEKKNACTHGVYLHTKINQNLLITSHSSRGDGCKFFSNDKCLTIHRPSTTSKSHFQIMVSEERKIISSLFLYQESLHRQ